MAVEDDDDIATFFEISEFAQAATFTPSAGGAAVAVTIVLDQPQEIQGLGFAGIAQTNTRAMLRRSEVADPAGGTLMIDGTAYRIVEPELDLAKKIWSVGLKP